jgi:hypothetical protein
MKHPSRLTQDILHAATQGGHLPGWLQESGVWMHRHGIGACPGGHSFRTMLPIGTPVSGPGGCAGIGASTAQSVVGIGCRRVRLNRR